MRGRPLLLLRGASQESAAAVLLARQAAPGSPSSQTGGSGEAGGVWAIITAVKFFDLVATIGGISAHGLCYHASFHQLVNTLSIQQCTCEKDFKVSLQPISIFALDNCLEINFPNDE